MSDRLSALDVSFLYLESPTTAMHVGSVAICEPSAGTATEGFDYEALCELVARRIALVPRYRQKVRWVPGRLANPVWVDDEDFDISYHVRRSALPRPGSVDQLRELVGRMQSRRLDRDRPLWEIYLVEGLDDGRFAILTKTHHAMVDGDRRDRHRHADPRPERRRRARSPDDGWVPRAEPSAARARAGAVKDNLTAPDPGRSTPSGPRSPTSAPSASASPVRSAGLLAAARTSLRPAPESPLNARDRRAAPLRDGRAPSSTTTSGCARRTAAPSTTSCSPPSPARCACGC